MYGHNYVVEILLTHGTAVNAKNDDGQTPLHLAKVRSNSGMGFVDKSKYRNVILLLQQHGGHE